MATVNKVAQVASFFAGKDQVKETVKIICVAAQRHGDFFAIGVDRHAKVNYLLCCLIHKFAFVAHRYTVMLQSPSCVNFPLIDTLFEGKIM